jgi:hypothetical protein
MPAQPVESGMAGLSGSAMADVTSAEVPRRQPDPATGGDRPDIAAGLATLGTDERAAGHIWHLPGPPTVTTRELLDLVAAEVGHPVGVRPLPKLAVRALGIVSPLMRELAEMSYEFDEPFILDTTRYRSTFGPVGTPLASAIAATVAWYRTLPACHDQAQGDERRDHPDGPHQAR